MFKELVNKRLPTANFFNKNNSSRELCINLQNIDRDTLKFNLPLLPIEYEFK